MKSTKEMIEVMTAYDNGAEIEKCEIGDNKWALTVPSWGWTHNDYRIKEPKKTITIEKWLCTDGKDYQVFQCDKNRFEELTKYIWVKVKLLDTYEVEI